MGKMMDEPVHMAVTEVLASKIELELELNRQFNIDAGKLFHEFYDVHKKTKEERLMDLLENPARVNLYDIG